MINFWDFQSIHFLKPIRRIFLLVMYATFYSFCSLHFAQPVRSKFPVTRTDYLFCHCEHTCIVRTVQSAIFSRSFISSHCVYFFLLFSFSTFRVTLHYAYMNCTILSPLCFTSSTLGKSISLYSPKQ